MKREKWGSKLGAVLAVAGSAIGLGNFLRFPVQAVRNGGGAFLIPYLITLVLMGLPLMWIEWTLGRFGGHHGHGSAPGIFQTIRAESNLVRFLSLLGVFGPVVIFIYYTYVESWLLGYSVFSLLGSYQHCPDQQTMSSFLRAYQGLEKNQFFSSVGPAYFFFLITFFLNILVVYRGVTRGIEKLCLWAVPLLFLLAVAIVARTLTLKPVVHQEWTPLAGLGFLWNPDFSSLSDARVWLAAAGQIFFTLSVGIGVILTYASYLSRDSDIIVSGMTAAASNELAEVILGGSIAIPAAFVFFGPAGIQAIARQGSFDLGFVTMPLVLKTIPLGQLFGFLWFSLLFLAGLTSSISLAQPALAFLQDELGLSRRQAVVIFALGTFALCHFAVILLGRGVVDELDFWG
ncbi:MAG TPA: sodium-dependent transporter, partial [bacterium]|nr:sodium-dependent transporter [bacterium]